VNDEFEMMWKEAVVALFEIIYQNFAGCAKKKTPVRKIGLQMRVSIWDFLNMMCSSAVFGVKYTGLHWYVIISCIGRF
jgi:hypothetical protein